MIRKNKLGIVIMALLLSGCQMDHSGRIDHVFQLDGEKIEEYFRAACQDKYPDAPEEQIEFCVDAAVGKFLDTLGELSAEGPKDKKGKKKLV